MQDLKADDEPHPEVFGDIQNLESMMNEAVIEGDISPKPSHKQDSQGYNNCWLDIKIDRSYYCITLHVISALHESCYGGDVASH